MEGEGEERGERTVCERGRALEGKKSRRRRRKKRRVHETQAPFELNLSPPNPDEPYLRLWQLAMRSRKPRDSRSPQSQKEYNKNISPCLLYINVFIQVTMSDAS